MRPPWLAEAALLAAALLAAPPLAGQEDAFDPARAVARAGALELPTPYQRPPGDPDDHHAAGYAKVMCSAVFITGLTPEFAARNVGFFVAPPTVRGRLGTPVIDRAARAVSVVPPSGRTRTAKLLGSQGCVTLPHGASEPLFTPSRVESALQGAERTPWPMGDLLPADPLPAGLDRALLERATAAAFTPPGSMTAAFVVTHRGRIVAERYGDGITHRTPLESWSMGKSLTATLLGVLVQQGVYRLDQPAPVPEWQVAGDPRARIRIRDLLQMSSGLRIRAPQDPDFDPGGPYPDHLYLYTGDENLFRYAAARPPQWPPGEVGRYRNTDPVLVNYLIRLAVESRGEDYHAFPRRALLDRIGMRTMVMETDAHGNFLTQGYELASARDWARLGNLYLQDGVWNGERLLPEGFARFVATPAPAWRADGRPIYGGFFWINGDGGLPVPADAFFMSGAGGQTTLIVPSHQLVVVRLGHFGGAAAAEESFARALALLLAATPR